ncbi:serine hydrolase, partial [bacterium]|nr:serine hydrolase [bacterium]
MTNNKGNVLRYLIFGVAVVAILLTTLGAGEAGPLLSTARPEEVGMDPERLARLDGLVDELLDTGRMPGVVLLVARHGNIVWREAYGMAEVEPNPRPMKVNTLFDLASLTKVVATSTAMM